MRKVPQDGKKRKADYAASKAERTEQSLSSSTSKGFTVTEREMGGKSGRQYQRNLQVIFRL